jgi:hypothetical protein
MTDYGHDMWFGAALPPTARDHAEVLAIAELADGLGLDLIGFQDHPYQAAFLDAWTLLSYVAARTIGSASSPTWPTSRCDRRPCSRAAQPPWTS